MRALRSACRALLLTLLAIAAGCYSSGPGVGQVTGTVRISDQKPLESDKQLTWEVVFLSKDGTKHTATVGSGGKYVVDAVPVGPAKIVVVGRTSVPAGLVAPGQPRFRPDEAHESLLKRLAPFSDPERSGLAHLVARGEQNRDIDLAPGLPK
jgi:hypothetical protein